jgi:hypothetical protein
MLRAAGVLLRALLGMVIGVLVPLGLVLLTSLAVVGWMIEGWRAETWPPFLYAMGFWLFGAAMLNLAWFFARLRRFDRELYLAATLGYGYIGFIATEWPAAVNHLHGWVARIALDRSGAFDRGLVRRAAITRRFNLACVWYFAAGMLALVLGALHHWLT